MRVVQKLSTCGDGTDHGEVFPAELGWDDGGLAAATPGADLRRLQTEAALVQKHERGAFSDFFFPVRHGGRGPSWRCRLRSALRPAARAADTRTPNVSVFGKGARDQARRRRSRR